MPASSADAAADTWHGCVRRRGRWRSVKPASVLEARSSLLLAGHSPMRVPSRRALSPGESMASGVRRRQEQITCVHASSERLSSSIEAM